jgi:uncharacterized protein YndB with AHSA1/START domain
MTISQLPTELDTLVVEADYPGVTATALFDYWTQAALLTQWWPQEAEIEPCVGGAYHLAWPAMAWHLRGQYTVFEPGERLGFTWRWDHDDPAEPTRQVDVTFTPLTDGTRLTVTHGPYDASPHDQELRAEHHLVGWTHFLRQLQSLVPRPSRHSRAGGRP